MMQEFAKAFPCCTDPKLLRRFIAKVEVLDDGCWEWAAALDSGGYGQFSLEGRNQLAHRVAYGWAVGAVPDDCRVTNTCENRACVNPSHLELMWIERGSSTGSTYQTGLRSKPAKNGSDTVSFSLYRCYSASGELLYIGITRSPGRRMRQHSREKPWWPEVAVMKWEHYPSSAELEDAERKAIQHERPKYNVVNNRAAWCEKCNNALAVGQ
jgi:hypothetical protein